MSHELELKLKLQPESMPGPTRVPRLLGKELNGSQRVEELESLYFDTPEEKLRKNGVSLRIRRDGKRSLQTIKWLKQSDLFERGQSETEISGKTPDWKAARGTALEPLLSKKLRRSLKPLFKTKAHKRKTPTVQSGSRHPGYERRSEFGGQVAVYLKSNADLNDARGSPGHRHLLL